MAPDEVYERALLEVSFWQRQAIGAVSGRYGLLEGSMPKYRIDAELTVDEADDLSGGLTVTFPADNLAQAVEKANELFSVLIADDCKTSIFQATEVEDEE